MLQFFSLSASHIKSYSDISVSLGIQVMSDTLSPVLSVYLYLLRPYSP